MGGPGTKCTDVINTIITWNLILSFLESIKNIHSGFLEYYIALVTLSSLNLFITISWRYSIIHVNESNVFFLGIEIKTFIISSWKRLLGLYKASSDLTINLV